MWFLRLLSYQPLQILYFYSDILFFITYYIIRYRKKKVMDNLAKAFPEKTEKERKKICKNFFRNLMDIVVENLKSITITEAEMRKRIRFKNPEILTDRLEKGNSVIVLTAHQSNWEWLLLGWSLYLDYGVDAIYKPISIKSLDDFMIEIREKFGAIPVPSNQVFRQIVKNKGQARAIAMVADQRPWGHESNYWTNFLGIDTAFFTGGETLARKMNFPIVFTGIKRVRRGYYEIFAEEIADPPFEQDKHMLIDIFVRRLEKMIQEDTENWLWTHDRWKYSREERLFINKRLYMEK